MIKIIFASILFLNVAFSKELPLSSRIFKKEEFVSHKENKPFGSYLVMNINYVPVSDLFNDLDKKLVGKLDKQNRRTEAHITVITPPEFDKVLKPYISIGKIHEIAQAYNIQASGFKIECIGEGMAIIDSKKEFTYFLVARSDNLLKIRNEIYKEFKKNGGHPSNFDPNLFYPHITIGYSKTDLHQGPHYVHKGLNSCKYKIKML